MFVCLCTLFIELSSFRDSFERILSCTIMHNWAQIMPFQNLNAWKCIWSGTICLISQKEYSLDKLVFEINWAISLIQILLQHRRFSHRMFRILVATQLKPRKIYFYLTHLRNVQQTLTLFVESMFPAISLLFDVTVIRKIVPE